MIYFLMQRAMAVSIYTFALGAFVILAVQLAIVTDTNSKTVFIIRSIILLISYGSSQMLFTVPNIAIAVDCRNDPVARSSDQMKSKLDSAGDSPNSDGGRTRDSNLGSTVTKMGSIGFRSSQISGPARPLSHTLQINSGIPAPVPITASGAKGVMSATSRETEGEKEDNSPATYRDDSSRVTSAAVDTEVEISAVRFHR